MKKSRLISLVSFPCLLAFLSHISTSPFSYLFLSLLQVEQEVKEEEEGEGKEEVVVVLLLFRLIFLALLVSIPLSLQQVRKVTVLDSLLLSSQVSY